MKDKPFIDTNILIYCFSATEPEKRVSALEVFNYGYVTVSTQVLQEFANVLFKKFNVEWTKIVSVINEITDKVALYINDDYTIIKACKIAEKYGYSFYDSLIIASALTSGSNILFTEDMQHNQTIESSLRIINPFVK